MSEKTTKKGKSTKKKTPNNAAKAKEDKLSKEEFEQTLKNMKKIFYGSEHLSPHLQPKDPKSIKVPFQIRLTKTSLEFVEPVSLEEYAEISDFLILQYRLENDGSLQFWIGDWLNYGEDRFKNRRVKKNAIENVLKYTFGSIKNMAYVAGRIESSRRRDNLSFSVHQEIAPFPPKVQEFWLDLVEKRNLTRTQLRELKTAVSIEGHDKPEQVHLGRDCVSISKKFKAEVKQLGRLAEELIDFKKIIDPKNYQTVAQWHVLSDEIIYLLKALEYLLRDIEDVLQKALEWKTDEYYHYFLVGGGRDPLANRTQAKKESKKLKENRDLACEVKEMIKKLGLTNEDENSTRIALIP